MASGDLVEALDQYQRLVLIAPKNSTFWLEAARLQEKLGYIEEAKKSYSKVLKFIPEHPVIAVNAIAATQKTDANLFRCFILYSIL